MKKISIGVILLLAAAAVVWMVFPGNEGPVLTAYIQDGTVSADGMTYVLENETEDYVFQFGAGYGLEKWELFSWKEFGPQTQSTIAMSYLVLPGDSRECQLVWTNRFGSLPAGRYRFVKHIERMNMDADEVGTKDGEYDLYLEFTIP